MNITYGCDSSNYQGTAQPAMYGTIQIDDNALYYAVTAQLSGAGKVTCEIQIGDAVRKGHAVGGYNICSNPAALANGPQVFVGGRSSSRVLVV